MFDFSSGASRTGKDEFRGKQEDGFQAESPFTFDKVHFAYGNSKRVNTMPATERSMRYFTAYHVKQLRCLGLHKSDIASTFDVKTNQRFRVR
jgi:hypothetical protein